MTNARLGPVRHVVIRPCLCLPMLCSHRSLVHPLPGDKTARRRSCAMVPQLTGTTLADSGSDTPQPASCLRMRPASPCRLSMQWCATIPDRDTLVS